MGGDLAGFSQIPSPKVPRLKFQTPSHKLNAKDSKEKTKKGCQTATFFYFCLINQYKLRNIYKLYFILSITLVAFSCKKEDNGKAPVLPKASSFVMDFSKFDSTITSIGDTTSINYNFAVQKLSSWNSLIKDSLNIPVQAFLESTNHTPQYLSDGWWSWKSTIVINQKYYKVDLRGKTTDINVLWEAYISEEIGFQDYKWFEGECDLFTNVGIWNVKNKPFNNEFILQINWTNYYQGEADIKYTNVLSSDSLYGSYVKYLRKTDSELNANYIIYEIIPENYSEINLNRTTINGQVKDSLYFPDYEFHCWDSLKLDSNCF